MLENPGINLPVKSRWDAAKINRFREIHRIEERPPQIIFLLPGQDIPELIERPPSLKQPQSRWANPLFSPLRQCGAPIPSSPREADCPVLGS